MAEWTDDASWLDDGLPKTICEKVSFIKLLDYFKIEYGTSWTGDFTHKMKCPLPLHACGEERTASCFVSDKTNKFYCFGCNNGGSVIDFIKLYTGKPYGETLKWLSQFAGITSSDINVDAEVKEKRKPEETVKFWVLRAGLELRKFLESYKGKDEYDRLCDKTEKIFSKLDEIFDQTKDENFEIAEKYYKKLKIAIDEERNKK